jgi:beta-aspartyl-dipeptidase (metallo-type)
MRKRHDNLWTHKSNGFFLKLKYSLKEERMITLLQGGQIFSPLPLGQKDILIVADKISAIAEPDQINFSGIQVYRIDASEKIILPGFIDSHVHMLGGGGEGGPATRAPEITVEEIIESGVTSLIGCLGTDGTTRHMESLLAKSRGLEKEGVSTYIFSGSYQIPVVTITGSVRSDLILIEKVIGAGEIAISDHRSSQPTFAEISRLAAECRVGGMLGGKAGVLHCHLGDGERRLEMLFKLINETEIPPTQVIPTHVNRNPALFEESMKFTLKGGYMDLTAGLDPEAQEEEDLNVPSAIKLCIEKQVPLTHITISSDSNGSMPVFDKKGNLAGLTIATQKSLLMNFRYLVQKDILKLEDVIKLFSTNPAQFYKLHNKGEISEGKDADLILLDQNYNLTDSFCMGRAMMADKKISVKGTFS